ncbi:DUF6443 domain-containing protein [Mucilaginibacter sp. 22184]|uniref:DUF6443 domain-containing protein n=1 Tax=Mucilaginibacter sp. 22184 TaxID=3453887 RepID=UPI003F864295
MKPLLRIKLLLLVLLFVCSLTYGQSTIPGATANQNYIITFLPNTGIPNNTSLTTNATDKAKVQVSIQYFDGLGRPLQTIKVKGSPLGKDIVQPFFYDEFERETQKYLPYVATTGDGSYKIDALTTGAGVNTFYNPTGSGVSGSQQSNGITVITAPYSQTLFEPSPLDRIIEQGAPGTDWQPASGHTQKIDFKTNNDTVLTDTTHTRLVALYRTTVNADQSQTLIRSGNYDPGQLNVIISKNENWKTGRGGTIEEYMDKQGRMVLKRSFIYVSTNPAQLQILSTYYVYDDYGNLAFILPPGVNADAAGVPPFAGSLGYLYRYDERNRMTQKKIPGKGWEFTVYNQLDQPVLTQDSLQRQNNQWMVTKYDQFGRIIMTGIWNAGSVIPLATLQRNIYAVTQWDTRDQTNNVNSYPSGYVLGSYPVLSKTLTINYFDDYNIPKLPSGYKVINGVSTMTKGLQTASKTAVLNTISGNSPDMLWGVNYYDDKGRSIRSYKQHYLSGAVDSSNFDVVINTYNFNNQVTTRNRRHFTKASTTAPRLTIINQYSYDHMDRKLTTREQLQNIGQAADMNPILAKIEYNELGQIWKKNLHSTDSITFKQSITYSYNERGWLQSSSAPLFAERLYYNTNSSKQYNGNIAYQYWGTADNLNNYYIYSYDQLNRLISGNSTTGNNELGINYDPMGNIIRLIRYRANTLIDQIDYTYTAGTNKLQSVNDAVAGTAGQKGGISNYSYDGNGNLTSDDSKGITAINYNLLNLPQTITGKNTTYTYDAAGQKLSRLIGTAKTDYIGGIQYDGTAAATTISFIQTEEGRALPNGSSPYNYEYSITDHLGNSRVNFDTATGVARSVQTDDYYPFGMDIIPTGSARISPQNEYLYNKKELQENLGLYDYGARFYDPAIARWGSIDAFAERYDGISPYSYGGVNPVVNIDVHGDSLMMFKNGVYQFTVDNGKKEITGFNQESTIDKDGKETFTGGQSFEFNDIKLDEADLKTGNEKLKILSRSDVENFMKNTDADKQGFFGRWGYALHESNGNNLYGKGTLDFRAGHGINHDGTMYVINGVGYNGDDAGNYLWGFAMARMGFTSTLTAIASNVNAWWSGKTSNGQGSTSRNSLIRWFENRTWTGDAVADQRAILKGYNDAGGYFKYKWRALKISFSGDK